MDLSDYIHIIEVSINIPEIVCLVSDKRFSIDDEIYNFPSKKEVQSFVTFCQLFQ